MICRWPRLSSVAGPAGLGPARRPKNSVKCHCQRNFKDHSGPSGSTGRPGHAHSDRDQLLPSRIGTDMQLITSPVTEAEIDECSLGRFLLFLFVKNSGCSEASFKPLSLFLPSERSWPYRPSLISVMNLYDPQNNLKYHPPFIVRCRKCITEHAETATAQASRD
jgi:hypothetical protein